MKIKLTSYPYNEFNVGDICDFGEEKNASLVSLQRAVFVGENPLRQSVSEASKKEPKKVVKETASNATDTKEEAETPKEEVSNGEPDEQESEGTTGKKLLENELQQEVQKRKEQIKSTPLRGPGGKFLSKKESNETGSEQVKKEAFGINLKVR